MRDDTRISNAAKRWAITWLCLMAAFPAWSQNLVTNGDFTANAALFTSWPGYVGYGNNPTNITAWSPISGSGVICGLNGAGTVTHTFGPTNDSGYTYLFIQGGASGLSQSLPALETNTPYVLTFKAAARVGETNDTFRAQIGDSTNVYVSSGSVQASNAAFQAYSYGFTTPAVFNGHPIIQLINTTPNSVRTIDFTAVSIQPAIITNQTPVLSVFLPASGNWNVSGNWSSAIVPGTNLDPDILNGSVATVNSDVGTCGKVYIGQGHQTNQTRTGTVFFQPGATLTAPGLYLGRDGTNYGQFNQSGGTLTVNGNVSVGDAVDSGGASGELNLSGGTLQLPGAGSAVIVGNRGLGRMLVTGNAVLSTPSVEVGATIGAAGSQLFQWGGTIYASNLTIGASSASNTSFTISSGVTSWTGTMQVNSRLALQGSRYLLQQAGAGGGLQLGSGATLEFDLDAQGVTPVMISSSKIGIAAGSKLVVDGTQYARWNGQPGSYTLVNHGGYSGATQFAPTNITLTGFGDLTPGVSFTSNSIVLTLTAPTNQMQSVGQGIFCEYWQVPITVKPGVSGRSIDAPLSAMPSFTNSLVAEHPIFGCVTTNINLSLSRRSTNFFMRFTGYLDVPTNGNYTFYLNSDDGSLLWLDGNLVVNNDGAHPLQEVSGTTNLTAGMHALTVAYFQAGGVSALTVSWAGPGVSRQVIPDSALFLSPTPNASARQPVYQNIVQDSEATYNYAPCFMYDEREGLYKVWMCGAGIPGATYGDHILYRQATSLEGLMSAPLTVALGPSWDPTKFDQIHACDPNVYRVGNLYYMTYSGNTDGSQLQATTRIGMAVSYDGGRTFEKLNDGNAIISPNLSTLGAGAYGTGQSAVTRAPDGYYYMIYTDINGNGVPNYERVVRSRDPAFTPGSFTNVASILESTLGGYSPDLGFDTNLNQFVVTVNPAPLTDMVYFDTNWNEVRSVTRTNPFSYTFGDGIGLLMNSQKQPVTYYQDGVPSYVMAGGTADATNDTTLWANWVAGDMKYLVLPQVYPPTLAAIPDTNLVAGNVLNITPSATDPNTPPQSLTFSLVTAPAGATINSTNGLIRWNPLASQNLVSNGNFIANAALFTNPPCYVGGSNPANVTDWTQVAGSGGYGINGFDTPSTTFGPVNDGGNTYLFIQGGGKTLVQNLPGLTASTPYTLTFLAASRYYTGESNDTFVVQIKDDSNVYATSSSIVASNTAFQTYSYNFTTPAVFNGQPSIQLENVSPPGDHTVDFTAVSVVQNQVANGAFTNNAAQFTSYPGYVSYSNNPPTVANWSLVAGSGDTYGVNGAGTATSVFGPANTGGSTFLFIQGGSNGLSQNLPALLPNTDYALTFMAAARSGEPSDTFRVQIGDATHVYVSSGNVVASDAAFQTYSYGFTTPSAFDGQPSLQIYNTCSSNTPTVDFTDISVALPLSTNNFIVNVADNSIPAMSAMRQFSVALAQPFWLTVTGLLNQASATVTNPVANPVLSNPVLTSGSFSFTVNGDSNQTYILEVATNLNPAVWIPIQTNTAGQTPFTFTDDGVVNGSQRFYRVRIGS